MSDICWSRLCLAAYKLFGDIYERDIYWLCICLAAYKMFDNILIVTFAGRIFVWLHIKCLITL